MRRVLARLVDVITGPPRRLRVWWDALKAPDQLMYSGVTFTGAGIALLGSLTVASIAAALIVAGVTFLAVLFVGLWRRP